MLIFLGVALALSALYLYAFPTASLLYETVVVFHLFFGACFLILALLGWLPLLRGRSLAEKLGWTVLFAGGVFGAVLLFTGASRREWPVLYTHELVTALACAVLLWVWSGRRGWLQGSALRGLLRLAVCLALTAALASGAWWVRTVPWQRSNTVHNPKIAPANADAEGDGPHGPFFPSMLQTTDGKTVPEGYFLSSASCKQCHADIYRQWESSAHHYSSFNNQWYLQSIVYMQAVDGVQASKLCAGCHDAALFYAGNFNTPIKDRVSTPAAQAGIGCVVCHSIRRVKSTMGDTDFVFAYPPLQKLVASNNPVLHGMVDYLIKVDPEPHRRTFMRPFMQVTPAQYCSACHKVHMDVPVNNYRWVRGFNEYDNWQASGVSGMGARSFYYPPKPMDCVDCHMTLTPSHDEGNVDGFVHSHRFIAANTALPFVNQDEVQLARTEAFLKGNKVRVDIFAISPETATQKPQTLSAASSGPQLETTFAVGEESGTGPIAATEAGIASAPITAPLDRVQAAVRPGETVRVDVVVRTLQVGHFFPGGTVDAFDCWLELKATDDRGRVLFWSGMVEDHGHGPVEPGAHFYRSLSMDAHGGPINKRNAWAARATVYVHLVPPGAADTAHFRLHIPRDAHGKVHLEAKLNYRKFSWVNTQFSFAGVFEDTGPHDVSKGYDDRRMVFTGDTSHVAGKIKAIPDLPIVVLASSVAELTVLPPGAPAPAAQVVLEKADWQRWNDYGIGLFLQGDMKGAGAAFTKATEIDANNPDGWVNIGRVRLQEGNLTGARQVLERALQIAPSLARANYFYARVLRQMGDYDGAIARLRLVLAQYPQDRVARNDLGRVFFLKHQYANAIHEFEGTLAIDPEDLEANYNLMLCYTGLGDATQAAAYETRFLRFKADESAQAITGPYLARHPEDNLERQPIHEHGSVPLSVANSADAQMKNTVSSPTPSAPSPSSRGGH
ncbi:MAG: tetratricopeptide repeat protein [Acidobacteriaceae bacterium]